jgi:hypothetical protein
MVMDRRTVLGALMGAPGLALAQARAPGNGQGGGHSGGHGRRDAPRAGLACSAAYAPDGALWIVGLGEQGRLMLRSSTDTGRTWGAPQYPDIGDDRVASDGESRPKLAFGPQGWVVVAWTQPLSRPYTGEIRMICSSDGGRTFGAPFTVHQDRQIITHRFESVQFDARGRLHVLWIDKRDTELARSAGQPWRGAAVYRTVSLDGGRSFGPDTLLAAHSCECCRIALAPAPDGGLVALWRHVFEPNLRDHAFMQVGDLQPPRGVPVRASHDGWALDACPHHGPGLAPAARGGYHAVWFGDRAGRAAVRYGLLAADGQPSGEPIELPDATAEHADVISDGQRVAVVWRMFDGQASVLKAWVSEDDGRTFRTQVLGRTTEDNDHPRLAGRPGQASVVWRTRKEWQVERLY